ncbi:MAG: exodeoxyribonuclease V subunit alpha [Candidatus Igneacidithiobacillus chanchocoensis]
MIPALSCAGSATRDALRAALCAAVETGCLRLWDAQFALFLRQQVPQAPQAILFAAALCSRAAGQGQVFLDLTAEFSDSPCNGLRQGFDDWQDWYAQAPELCSAGEGNTPLVLRPGRLYLRRLWVDERKIEAEVVARLEALPLPLAEEVARHLDCLFAQSTLQPDWQRIACALMLPRRLGVISGGPGTGKTTTVLRLLLLLQALAQAGLLPGQQGLLRIRLAAPTGKAAARLSQTLTAAMTAPDLREYQALLPHLPQEVETVHRLLGLRSDGSARQHRHRPLALDLLIIDEASMLSQEMMARVLDALPPAARLILLGDKDQLASVEAGAVLAQLCAHAEAARYSVATRDWIAATCGCSLPAPEQPGSEREQALVLLRHSYRFAQASGIGRLAEKIRQGQTQDLQEIWEAADLRLLTRISSPALDQLLLHGWAGDPDAPGYLYYLAQLRAGQQAGLDPDALAQRCLQAYTNFQLLCASRDGPWGVTALNLRITQLLQAAGQIAAGREWFAGRPVMITRNRYSLGLMNGEVGMTLPVTLADGERHLQVAFWGGDGGIRWFSPWRLQDLETVFALTVHKSQGSEYEHCAFLAADEDREFLQRELLYTALTRARSRFSLALSGDAELVHVMIGHSTARNHCIFDPTQEKAHE